MVEICCFSLESAIIAQEAGAKRVELCGGMFEGGTTPSAGLIKRVRACLAIQLYVMIRPRGGDFCYSKTEFEVMQEDIELAKSLGADGVVFGILNPDGSIDKVRTKILVDLASPMKVTFHRAFDVAQNPRQALEDIIECACERILTSGQKNTALEGIDCLKALVEQANNRIEIMAGSGVHAANAEKFVSIGIKTLHLTGKSTRDGKMLYRKKGVSMASISQTNEHEYYEADAEKCKAVVDIMNRRGN